jgi:hypothetical protein
MGEVNHFAEAAWLGSLGTLLREQEQSQRQHGTDYKCLNPHHFESSFVAFRASSKKFPANPGKAVKCERLSVKMQIRSSKDALYIFAWWVTSSKDHKYMTCRGKKRNQPKISVNET